MPGVVRISNVASADLRPTLKRQARSSPSLIFIDDEDESRLRVNKNGSGKRSTSRPPSEVLPPEILTQIFTHLLNDKKSANIYQALRNIYACLPVCKAFYYTSLPILYQHVPIQHAGQFTSFLDHIRKFPHLGRLVKCLDFSAFSAVGLGRTARDNQAMPNLTAKTIEECLELTPNLEEFLVSMHMENDLDHNVMERLFSLRRLEAIDFCGSTSDTFNKALSSVNLDHLPRLKRVSFHECQRLPAYFFEEFLPKLHHLTHLDVSHTRCSSRALLSIPTDCRVTHLGIARCKGISGDAIAGFLLTNPAASEMFYLNIGQERTSPHPLTPELLDLVLPGLPQTLEQIDLDGAAVTGHHLRQLPPFLTELSIAQSLVTVEDTAEFLEQPGCQLHYLNITGVRSIDAFQLHQRPIFLHGSVCVYEVGALLQETLQTDDTTWQVLQGRGARGWYVRQDELQEAKSIARWCSHKVDCCESLERVRGIYSYYSFSV